jgi:hypothetical protein
MLVYRLVQVYCQVEILLFPKIDTTCFFAYACVMSSTITGTLRDAVNSSEESRYAIAKGAGIDEAGLKRFADGNDARGVTLDKLADYFGLELKARRGRK